MLANRLMPRVPGEVREQARSYRFRRACVRWAIPSPQPSPRGEGAARCGGCQGSQPANAELFVGASLLANLAGDPWHEAVREQARSYRFRQAGVLGAFPSPQPSLRGEGAVRALYMNRVSRLTQQCQSARNSPLSLRERARVRGGAHRRGTQRQLTRRLSSRSWQPVLMPGSRYPVSNGAMPLSTCTGSAEVNLKPSDSLPAT